MRDDERGKGTSQELRSINLLDFFDQELRPIFCVDADRVKSEAQEPEQETLNPVFRNTFLRVSGLWAKFVPAELLRLPKDNPAWTFVNWVRCKHPIEVESSRFMKYEGIHWSKTTLLDRWNVITGTFCSSSLEDTPIVKNEKALLEAALTDAQESLLRGVVDQGYRETSEPHLVLGSDEPFAVDRGRAGGQLDSDDVHYGKRNDPREASEKREKDECDGWFESFDWSSSELGPMEGWHPDLKKLRNMLHADTLPAAAYWGPNRVMLYNSAYQWILGNKHPQAMGQPFDHVWHELAQNFAPFFKNAALTGQATTCDDTEFHVERAGFIEQTYFSWSIIPLFWNDGDSKQVSAFYNPTRETTVQQTLYRRMLILLGVSQRLNSVTTVSDYWQELVNALDDGAHDVPFTLMYGAESLEERSGSALTSGEEGIRRWTLKGTVGYPLDVSALPTVLDFDDPEEDLKALVSSIDGVKEPRVLSTTDGSFPARLMTTVHVRSYEESCSKAIYCPIRPSGVSSIATAGFMIMGLNPRRPYDSTYKLFVELLVRQLSASMAAVLLFAETVRRGKQDKAVLSRKLATQIKKTADSEVRFQRMADYAPVAMFKIDPDGRLEYGNDDYFSLTQSDRNSKHAFAYRDAVEDIDLEAVEQQWDRLTRQLQPINEELRLRKRWTSPDGKESSTWVIAAAYPEMDDHGNVTGVLGCLTDISRHKWAEQVQAQRTEHAMTLRRQQELFMDMTSHEMRNPLSAVIQSADGIIATIDQSTQGGDSQYVFSAGDVEGIMDAAQTIVFCAQHQKRISDDVLIFSKLNANLVTITPVEAQPGEVIEKGLRVFERELSKNDIELSLEAEESYRRLKVGALRLDPSRMLQILINLVSNAIKFTESQAERRISVRYGASLSENFEKLEHIRFWHKDGPDSVLEDRLSGPEWGEGEVVYLYLSVQDTGRGLRAEEVETLFQRFSQASPRTHIKYGGSGLGLFISKSLSEAQGGAIGAKSSPGAGSTFAFYIKTRRSESGGADVAAPAGATAATAPSQSIVASCRERIVMGGAGIGQEKGLSTPPPGRSSRTKRRGKGSAEKGQETVSAAEPLKPSVPDCTLNESSSDQVQPPNLSLDTHFEDKLHALIVEDNLVNQRVLKKQMEKAGYAVAVANHGVEALDHLQRTIFWHGDVPVTAKTSVSSEDGSDRRSNPRPLLARHESSQDSAESEHLGLSIASPVHSSAVTSSPITASIGGMTENQAPLRLDVVLMDLEMPVMDGITCVKRIRELQKEKTVGRVPVIAVTANARPEQIQEARDAGVDSVVCKPFRIAELTSEITRVLTEVGSEGA